jgi:hypothetical protein
LPPFCFCFQLCVAFLTRVARSCWRQTVPVYALSLRHGLRQRLAGVRALAEQGPDILRDQRHPRGAGLLVQVRGETRVA